MIGPEQIEAQHAIVREAVEDAGPRDWIRLEIPFVSVSSVMTFDFRKHLPDRVEQVEDTSIFLALDDLKRTMTNEHGSWLSSHLTVEPDGRFHFDFNYDEKPTWPDGREILDDTFVEDLKEFPRPWDEIPDWHPVKQQYTPESWAAEVTRE